MKRLTKKQFFESANGDCKTRLFDESDYENYCVAIHTARKHQKKGEPFYREDSAGGVANSYKYPTTTARWYVFISAEGTLCHGAERVFVRGPNVPCAFHGGERAYHKHFRESRVTV
jgi:hypothetical protein